ncbi:MAG: serine hydrolase, partial [Calditrichales bacterium]
MKYMWIWVICLLSSSLILAADKTTQIDNLLQSYANDEQFSGSILVAEKGQVIYKKSFGYANLEW